MYYRNELTYCKLMQVCKLSISVCKSMNLHTVHINIGRYNIKVDLATLATTL